MLKWVGLPESSYYYKETGKAKGAKPSVYTEHVTHGPVGEAVVIAAIKKVLSHEFIDCGYRIVYKRIKPSEKSP